MVRGWDKQTLALSFTLEMIRPLPFTAMYAERAALT